eukprot:COSAG01_NODE_10335_length_2191_cov_1.579828_3_plen_218_part_00
MERSILILARCCSSCWYSYCGNLRCDRCYRRYFFIRHTDTQAAACCCSLFCLLSQMPLILPSVALPLSAAVTDPPSRTKAPLIMMKFALLAAAPLAALGIPQGCDICAKDKQEYCELFPNAAACKTPCGFEVRVAPSLSLSHTHVHIHTHTHRPMRVPLAQHHPLPPSSYSLCFSDGVTGLSDGWVPAALSGYAVRREDKDVLGARNCPGGPRSGER